MDFAWKFRAETLQTEMIEIHSIFLFLLSTLVLSIRIEKMSSREKCVHGSNVIKLHIIIHDMQKTFLCYLFSSFFFCWDKWSIDSNWKPCRRIDYLRVLTFGGFLKAAADAIIPQGIQIDKTKLTRQRQDILGFQGRVGCKWKHISINLNLVSSSLRKARPWRKVSLIRSDEIIWRLVLYSKASRTSVKDV